LTALISPFVVKLIVDGKVAGIRRVGRKVNTRCKVEAVWRERGDVSGKRRVHTQNREKREMEMFERKDKGRDQGDLSGKGRVRSKRGSPGTKGGRERERERDGEQNLSREQKKRYGYESLSGHCVLCEN
jgi:hypothetical protein